MTSNCLFSNSFCSSATQELCLLDDDTSVYKMVGPVLMSQPVDDAKSTVEKRLEFIGGEL